jgi:Arc/MetJ-type ribon-helix-helix transcriptional regulator
MAFNIVAPPRIFPYPEGEERERRESVPIQLTPEQERRVQDVISRGAYESVEEVVDAALAAVE